MWVSNFFACFSKFWILFFLVCKLSRLKRSFICNNVSKTKCDMNDIFHRKLCLKIQICIFEVLYFRVNKNTNLYWQRFRLFILHILIVLNHVLTIFDRSRTFMFTFPKPKNIWIIMTLKYILFYFRALGVIFGIIILSLITASTIFVIYYCKTKKENIKALGHLNGKNILFFNILRFCFAPWLFYSEANPLAKPYRFRPGLLDLTCRSVDRNPNWTKPWPSQLTTLFYFGNEKVSKLDYYLSMI